MVRTDSYSLRLDLSANPPSLSTSCPLEARNSIPRALFEESVSHLNRSFASTWTRSYLRKYMVKPEERTAFRIIGSAFLGIGLFIFTLLALIVGTDLWVIFIQPAIFSIIGIIFLSLSFGGSKPCVAAAGDIITQALPEMNIILDRGCQAEFRFESSNTARKTLITPKSTLTLQVHWIEGAIKTSGSSFTPSPAAPPTAPFVPGLAEPQTIYSQFV